MYAGSAAVYGAKHQTRCLAAVLGDQERHRFLTGSTSLREPNEVRPGIEPRHGCRVHPIPIA